MSANCVVAVTLLLIVSKREVEAWIVVHGGLKRISSSRYLLFVRHSR